MEPESMADANGCPQDAADAARWERLPMGVKDAEADEREVVTVGQRSFAVHPDVAKIIHSHALIVGEATELLRNATYRDGAATVLTQDCEALQSAIAKATGGA